MNEYMLAAFNDELQKISVALPANVIRGVAPKLPAGAPTLGAAAKASLDSMGIKKLPTMNAARPSM